MDLDGTWGYARYAADSSDGVAVVGGNDGEMSKIRAAWIPPARNQSDVFVSDRIRANAQNDAQKGLAPRLVHSGSARALRVHWA